MTSEDRNLIGNFEVVDDEVVTRREVLLMGALAAGSLVAAAPASAQTETAAASTAAIAPGDPYIAKDFSRLISANMKGLSSNQIDQHIKLYKGYVSKANEIQSKLKDADITGANATYSPLRELLVEQSYALNGVVYHEFYFGNIGGKGGEPTGDLSGAISERWGSIGKFMDMLKASGKCMRGWVIVGLNIRDNQLHLYGLDMHNMWVPASVVPILVLDVYEHAYMIDYGTDRGKYLDSFVANLDWNVVANRFAAARKHTGGADSTT